MASNAPPIVRPAFDVKLVSPLALMGTYRIFVDKSDLLFIQLDGGKTSIIAVLAPFFGPFGGLIPVALWLLGKRKESVNRDRLKTEDPEKVLRESEAGFKLHVAEIRDATIEAPKVFMESGKAGRLNFLVRHGERIKCEFAETGQMKQAIELLSPLLNATLVVKAEWNAQKGVFEKKKERGVTV